MTISDSFKVTRLNMASYLTTNSSAGAISDTIRNLIPPNQASNEGNILHVASFSDFGTSLCASSISPTTNYVTVLNVFNHQEQKREINHVSLYSLMEYFRTDSTSQTSIKPTNRIELYVQNKDTLSKNVLTVKYPNNDAIYVSFQAPILGIRCTAKYAIIITSSKAYIHSFQRIGSRTLFQDRPVVAFPSTHNPLGTTAIYSRTLTLSYYNELFERQFALISANKNIPPFTNHPYSAETENIKQHVQTLRTGETTNSTGLICMTRNPLTGPSLSAHNQNSLPSQSGSGSSSSSSSSSSSNNSNLNGTSFSPSGPLGMASALSSSTNDEEPSTDALNLNDLLPYDIVVLPADPPVGSQQNKYAVTAFRLDNFTSISTFSVSLHPIRKLQLSYNGRLLAVASESGTLIRIFNVLDGTLAYEFRRGMKAASIASMSFSIDNKLLAVASVDSNSVHIFALDDAVFPYKKNTTSSANSSNVSNKSSPALSPYNSPSSTPILSSRNDSNMSLHTTMRTSSRAIPINDSNSNSDANVKSSPQSHNAGFRDSDDLTLPHGSLSRNVPLSQNDFDTPLDDEDVDFVLTLPSIDKEVDILVNTPDNNVSNIWSWGSAMNVFTNTMTKVASVAGAGISAGLSAGVEALSQAAQSVQNYVEPPRASCIIHVKPSYEKPHTSTDLSLPDTTSNHPANTTTSRLTKSIVEHLYYPGNTSLPTNSSYPLAIRFTEARALTVITSSGHVYIYEIYPDATAVLRREKILFNNVDDTVDIRITKNQNSAKSTTSQQQHANTSFNLSQSPLQQPKSYSNISTPPLSSKQHTNKQTKDILASTTKKSPSTSAPEPEVQSKPSPNIYPASVPSTQPSLPASPELINDVGNTISVPSRQPMTSLSLLKSKSQHHTQQPKPSRLHESLEKEKHKNQQSVDEKNKNNKTTQSTDQKSTQTTHSKSSSYTDDADLDEIEIATSLVSRNTNDFGQRLHELVQSPKKKESSLSTSIHPTEEVLDISQSDTQTSASNQRLPSKPHESTMSATSSHEYDIEYKEAREEIDDMKNSSLTTNPMHENQINVQNSVTNNDITEENHLSSAHGVSKDDADRNESKSTNANEDPISTNVTPPFIGTPTSSTTTSKSSKSKKKKKKNTSISYATDF